MPASTGKTEGRTATIYSLNGAAVRTIDIPHGLSGLLNISPRLPAGVYFIKNPGAGAALIKKVFVVP